MQSQEQDLTVGEYQKRLNRPWLPVRFSVSLRGKGDVKLENLRSNLGPSTGDRCGCSGHLGVCKVQLKGRGDCVGAASM